MKDGNAAASTVVITGASSGIGRATAMAFAREGYRLVLAARGADALEEVAVACRRLGAPALAVPTDETDAGAVRALAAEAHRFGGRVDVWFSNVGVGAVGRFLDTPIEAHEQVIRANLISHINDAHAVLPIFLRQDHGVFINMISLGGFASTPFAVAYGASKFGLRGFSEALRAELADHPHIHICDVYPSFVDTPGLGHGANYVGRALRVPPGALDARTVAARVVRLALRPRASTVIGPEVALLRISHAIAPKITLRIMARVMNMVLHRADRAPATSGNLFAPPDERSAIDGSGRSPNQRVAIGAAAVLALTMATVLGSVALSRWTRRS